MLFAYGGSAIGAGMAILLLLFLAGVFFAEEVLCWALTLLLRKKPVSRYTFVAVLVLLAACAASVLMTLWINPTVFATHEAREFALNLFCCTAAAAFIVQLPFFLGIGMAISRDEQEGHCGATPLSEGRSTTER